MATQTLEIRVLDKTANALGNIKGRIDRLNKGLLGINRVAGFASAALAGIFGGNLLRSIVQTSARFEDLRTALSSVTGSAKTGAQAFDFVSKFSTKTQFGIEELSETFIKLKAAGIEPTEKLLTTFTDTAAITTDQIGSLEAITDLFSRTVSGGLGLEELNRLADRGVPVFRILEEQLGLTRLEISNFGKTAEGATKIRDALQKGLDELAGGATAARVNNLSTSISNLQIASKNAQDAIGRQGFALALGDLTKEITETITSNDELVKKIGLNLTKAFLGVVAVGKLVIANIGLIGKAFGAFLGIKIALSLASIATAFAVTLTKGMAIAAKGLKALALVAIRHPLIGGIALAIGGIEYFTGAISKLAEKFGLVGEDSTFDNLVDQGKEFAGTLIGSDGIVKGLGDFKKEMDDINGKAIKLSEEANKVNDTLKNTKNALDSNNDEIDKGIEKAKELTDEFKKLTSVLGDFAITGGIFEEFDPIKQKLEERRKVIDDAFKNEQLDADQHQKAIAKIEADAARARQKRDQDSIKETVELIKQGKATEADIAVLGEENKNRLLGALGKEFINTLAQTNEKAFKIAKAIAITETIINTARGIVKALGQGGIFGFASAAVIAATGAAQLAQIKSTQYTGPREKGGQVAPNQSYLVGEAGPEVIKMGARGGTVIPNNQMGNQVTVNFNIETIDATGFDELLIDRRSTIVGVINEAMNRQGREGITA